VGVNPYKTPESDPEQGDERQGRYASYAEVPFYRRQWFFWISYLLLTPLAILLLLFGDVYYVKDGRVVSFGLANRIVAGLIALGILYNLVR